MKTFILRLLYLPATVLMASLEAMGRVVNGAQSAWATLAAGPAQAAGPAAAPSSGSRGATRDINPAGKRSSQNEDAKSSGIQEIQPVPYHPNFLKQQRDRDEIQR